MRALLRDGLRTLNASLRVVALALCVIGFLFGCTETSPLEPPLPPAEPSVQAPQQFTAWPTNLKRLRVAVTPYQKREALEATFHPLFRHLSARLRIEVEFVPARDYEHVVSLVAEQKVDLAHVSPVVYITLQRRDPKLHLLARQVGEGALSYLGYLVVRDDHPARSVGELQGSSFCFVDPLSTSGYLYPRALLRRRGYDLERFVGETRFGGTHEGCLEAVLAGDVQVATISSGTVWAARNQGLAVDRIRILAKTDRIPYDPWVARSGLPKAAAQRLREELLAVGRHASSSREILRGPIEISAWTEVSDEVYDVVRKALGDER